MTERKPLTRIQTHAMGAIIEIWSLEGRSPSLAELAFELDLKHRSGAQRIAGILRKKGWLKPVTLRQRYSLVPTVEAIGRPGDYLVELTDAGREYINQEGAMA